MAMETSTWGWWLWSGAGDKSTSSDHLVPHLGYMLASVDFGQQDFFWLAFVSQFHGWVAKTFFAYRNTATPSAIPRVFWCWRWSSSFSVETSEGGNAESSTCCCATSEPALFGSFCFTGRAREMSEWLAEETAPSVEDVLCCVWLQPGFVPFSSWSLRSWIRCKFVSSWEVCPGEPSLRSRISRTVALWVWRKAWSVSSGWVSRVGALQVFGCQPTKTCGERWMAHGKVLGWSLVAPLPGAKVFGSSLRDWWGEHPQLRCWVSWGKLGTGEALSASLPLCGRSASLGFSMPIKMKCLTGRLEIVAFQTYVNDT